MYGMRIYGFYGLCGMERYCCQFCVFFLFLSLNLRIDSVIFLSISYHGDKHQCRASRDLQTRFVFFPRGDHQRPCGFALMYSDKQALGNDMAWEAEPS